MYKKVGRPKKDSSQDAAFKLRMSRKTLEKLRFMAEEKQVSMSELVRLWIDKNWQSM